MFCFTKYWETVFKIGCPVLQPQNNAWEHGTVFQLPVTPLHCWYLEGIYSFTFVSQIYGRTWRRQEMTPLIPYPRDQETFSVKGQRANILGFVGCRVSLPAIQLCRCSAKAATDNTWANECGYVLTQPYLWTLKFEFHVIFICHKILHFFWFLPIV